jgi:hypothetical protein
MQRMYDNIHYVWFIFQDTALTAKRELRKAEWESFIDNMSQKCTKVDATFQEKEAELKEFYSDLEKKLHIGK